MMTMHWCPVLILIAWIHVLASLPTSEAVSLRTGVRKSKGHDSAIADVTKEESASGETISLFLEPTSKNFVGVDRCVDVMETFEIDARRDGLARIDLISKVKEGCEAEFQMAFGDVEGRRHSEGDDRDNKNRPSESYCFVIDHVYHPRGFHVDDHNRDFCNTLRGTIQNGLTESQYEEQRMFQGHDDGYEETALRSGIFGKDQVRTGCCMKDAEIAEKIAQLENILRDIRTELSQRHDMLHRSRGKWPEKMLIQRIQASTELLNFAGEIKDAFVHALELYRRYQELTVELEAFDMNVTVANEFAHVRIELHVAQAEAELKFAMLNLQRLQSKGSKISKKSVDAAKDAVKKAELELVNAQEAAHSDSIAATLDSEADAIWRQLQTLGDLESAAIRASLRAKVANLRTLARRLEGNGESNEHIEDLLRSAKADAKAHPKDAAAQRHVTALETGLDKRELASRQLIAALDRYEAQDCASCFTNVVGVLRSIMAEDGGGTGSGTSLGDGMQVYCRKSMEFVGSSDAFDCKDFEDVFRRNDENLPETLINFCRAHHACEAPSQRRLNSCQMCVSDGKGALNNKVDAQHDRIRTMRDFCVQRLQSRWRTQPVVIEQTCSSAHTHDDGDDGSSAERDHEDLLALCHVMGECQKHEDGSVGKDKKGTLEQESKVALADVKALHEKVESATEAVESASKHLEEVRERCDGEAAKLDSASENLSTKEGTIHKEEAKLLELSRLVSEAQDNATSAEGARVAAAMFIQSIESTESARRHDVESAVRVTRERVEQQRHVSEARLVATVGRANQRMIGVRMSGASNEDAASEEARLAAKTSKAIRKDKAIQASLDAELAKQLASNESASIKFEAQHREAQQSLNRTTVRSRDALKKLGALQSRYEVQLKRVGDLRVPLTEASASSDGRRKEMTECKREKMLARVHLEAVQNAKKNLERRVEDLSSDGIAGVDDALKDAVSARKVAADSQQVGNDASVTLSLRMVSHTNLPVKITPGLIRSVKRKLKEALHIDEPDDTCVIVGNMKPESSFHSSVSFDVHVCVEAGRTLKQLRDSLTHSLLFPLASGDNPLPTFDGSQQLQIVLANDSRSAEVLGFSVSKCAIATADRIRKARKSDLREHMKTRCVGELSMRLGSRSGVMQAKERKQIHDVCDAAAGMLVSAGDNDTLRRAEAFCGAMHDALGPSHLKASTTTSEDRRRSASHSELPRVVSSNTFVFSAVKPFDQNGAPIPGASRQLVDAMESRYRKRWQAGLDALRTSGIEMYPLSKE